MKEFVIACLAVSSCIAGQAHAEEGQPGGRVSLFGLADAGVSYVSNEGGNRNIKFDDGIVTPNLFGLRGTEDLGNGSYVLFQLFNQFSVGTGNIVGSGLFARTAYLGLENDGAGRLTLGNQYDFMSDMLFASGCDAARDVGGLYNFRNGPFQKLALPANPTGAFDWDRLAGSPVANSVKYVAPAFNGLRVGAMYGFGGGPGSLGVGSTESFGAQYAAGPFGAAAAYTNEKYPVSGGVPAASVRNWGVGAHYVIGSLNTSALITTVRNSASDGAVWMSEFGGTWHFDAALSLGIAYMYMKGNVSLDNNHAHQVTASLQYWLSKRTLVYASGAWQRANNGAQAQINGVLDPNGMSSNAVQSIARIGVQTAF
ncbi:Outer membrane protein (porin) [Paraburkholderia steynii]|uniref:Outer membrane protein (Porin) n=1 Tax=Paraburkholderia steynii TaxID=1245441 RepID=A0A7Z7BB05_9BURK|nr:porin [Paraburkholderia steynii]SDI50555.1 Outer membrane protein (porin) [Paraburkholderia steynii]